MPRKRGTRGRNRPPKDYAAQLEAVKRAVEKLKYSPDNPVTRKEDVRKIGELAGLGKKPDLLKKFLDTELGVWGLTEPTITMHQSRFGY